MTCLTVVQSARSCTLKAVSMPAALPPVPVRSKLRVRLHTERLEAATLYCCIDRLASSS